jgi:hypothetical protein
MNQWRLRSELVWAGSETVRELLINLRHARRTVVKLPSGCHPLLSTVLYGTARPRNRIDIVADSDLLLRISEIDELAALADLVSPMRDTGTRLRLRSPYPHLVFNFGARPAVVSGSGRREWQLGERWIGGPTGQLCDGKRHQYPSNTQQLALSRIVPDSVT